RNYLFWLRVWFDKLTTSGPYPNVLKLIFIIFINFNIYAKIEINPKGYVKFESFLDTRQVCGQQEDQSLYFPLRKIYNKFGQDLTKHPRAHMVAIESTVGLELGT